MVGTILFSPINRTSGRGIRETSNNRESANWRRAFRPSSGAKGRERQRGRSERQKDRRISLGGGTWPGAKDSAKNVRSWLVRGAKRKNVFQPRWNVFAPAGSKIKATSLGKVYPRTSPPGPDRAPNASLNAAPSHPATGETRPEVTFGNLQTNWWKPHFGRVILSAAVSAGNCCPCRCYSSGWNSETEFGSGGRGEERRGRRHAAQLCRFARLAASILYMCFVWRIVSAIFSVSFAT